MDGHGSAFASLLRGKRGRGWRRGGGNGRRGCGIRGRRCGRARFSFFPGFFGRFACHPVWGPKTCPTLDKACPALEKMESDNGKCKDQELSRRGRVVRGPAEAVGAGGGQP